MGFLFGYLLPTGLFGFSVFSLAVFLWEDMTFIPFVITVVAICSFFCSIRVIVTGFKLHLDKEFGFGGFDFGILPPTTNGRDTGIRSGIEPLDDFIKLIPLLILLFTKLIRFLTIPFSAILQSMFWLFNKIYYHSKIISLVITIIIILPIVYFLINTYIP